MENKRLNYYQAHKNKKPKKLPPFICPKKMREAYLSFLEEIERHKNKNLFFLLLLIFASCGTRKTDTQQRDSIHVENSYSNGSKIVLGNAFIYKPFDSLKPMVIEGKTYKNVIITNDKTKVVEKWNDRYITKTVVTEKNKQTEKTDNTILYIGLFAVLVLGVLLFFTIKRVTPYA